MAQLAVIAGLLIVATFVNVGRATHANCESDPDCPGKCRASCLAGEVVSSESVENNGCKTSPAVGYVDYCCRAKGQLTSTDIAFASSSTNLPIHPAANAVDGSLSTEWQPIPNAALPQWVQVTFTKEVCLVEATITRGNSKNIKKFQVLYDGGSSAVFTWPKSEGATKTVSLATEGTHTVTIKILEKFNPNPIAIKEFGNFVALSTP